MIAALAAAMLTLHDVQRAALTHSPAVARARAVVRERAALLDAADASAAPGAFANYVQSPQAGSMGGTIAQHLTTAGMQISLGDVARRGAAITQARAQLRAAEQSERDTERTERIAAVGLYFDAIRTRAILGLQRRIVDAVTSDVRAATLRYKTGDAPRMDVVRANVAYALARADLARAKAAADNAAYALAIETGIPDATLHLPTLADVPRETAAPPSSAAAVAFALRERPDVLAARAAVAEQIAALDAARRGQLPMVTAQAGWATGIDSGLHVSGPSVNVTLDVPLSRASGDLVAAARSRIDEARATLDLQLQNVTLETAAAERTYSADVDAAAAASQARDEARIEMRATEQGYRAGASSSIELEDARRTYAQASVEQTTALSALLQARAALDLTMGITP